MPWLMSGFAPSQPTSGRSVARDRQKSGATRSACAQRTALLFCAVLFLASTCLSQSLNIRFDPGWFLFASTYTYYPLGDMQQDFSNGVSNAFQIEGTALDDPISGFTKTSGTAIISGMPGSVSMLQKMGWPDTSAAHIQQQFSRLQSLAGTLGTHKVWWSIMPEYDQSGGTWPGARKVNYATRSDAYLSWRDSYLNNYAPLGYYLQLSPSVRAVGIIALNDYCFATHYSYELGADMAVLERNNDEMGDVQTGICFVRGAARQYNKPWGIDISTWRAATQSPTEFSTDSKLIGGWSASYFRRNLYVAYMSGANLILNEPVVRYNGGTLNPLGRVTNEVADFCLRRHRDVGKTAVRTAMMLDFNHGFEPKHGQYSQANYVWYGHLPYADGDYMTHYVLDMIFPGHWKSGTLPAGAPLTPQAYKQALFSGQDSRPWEPMGASRWGDQFDVILTNASIETMRKYSLIVLVGGYVVNDSLLSRLDKWVSEGGNLVTHAGQIRPQDGAFVGVSRSGLLRRSTSSVWRGDSSTSVEGSYQYEAVTTTSATPIAVSDNGDPLFTRNSRGTGLVYFSASPHLLNEARTGILSIAQKLFDTLIKDVSYVSVEGTSQVQYIVNKSNDKVVVTLVNNTSALWEGRVEVTEVWQSCVAHEWISDGSVTVMWKNGRPGVGVTIPPYDVKVVAFEKNQGGAAVPDPGSPESYGLSQNYPNPFNPTTRISFHALRGEKVTLRVFDMLGRLVQILLDGEVTAGLHEVTFDGGGFASGTYSYILQSPDARAARQMVLLR